MVLICGATPIAHSAPVAVCQSAASDSDGDGWGWENQDSCIIDSTGVVPIAPQAAIPQCTSATSDTDNDGWGWENNRSCTVSPAVVTVSPANPVPACSSATSDHDNDGWGWENNRSCVVGQSIPQAPGNTDSGVIPVCSSGVADHDNDGWGWEQNRSCTISGSNTPAPVQTSPLKIMAVGDSITHGVSNGPAASYRMPFAALLNNNGCNYRFVGSQTSNYNHNTFVSPHEGYVSHTADHFLTGHNNYAGNNAGIAASMNAFDPDIVLLHIGTNDMRLGQDIDQTLSEIDQIITNILDGGAEVLVANLIPWYLAAEQDVHTLGSRIEAYVAQLANPAVKLVDVRSGYSLSMMLADRAHPNATGDAHIADAFYSVFSTSGFCVPQ